MHKAKGKEFDNVFIMLEDFTFHQDEAKRVFYVAMTRAKNHLTIHLNNNYLNSLPVEQGQKTTDPKNYPPPDYLVEQLTHRDVNLGYFKYAERFITELTSGEEIKYKGDGCSDSQGRPILKFSKDFLEKIKKREKENFQIEKVRVNFILYWQGEDLAKEIKIILPVIHWQQRGSIFR